MKARVHLRCPEARFVDVSHSVPPFDVEAGAFLLWAGTRYFGPDSVHLGVVDPGVGTDRRAVAVECLGRTYVGPDNGLFHRVLDEAAGDVAAVQLERPPEASRTFEGRDVFAPAAGRVAAGEPLAAIGRPVDPAGLVRLEDRGPRVLWVDRFGNLVLSLSGPARPLEIGAFRVEEVAETFGAAPARVPFCYVGSLGLLEVGVREGRADEALGARVGTPVGEAARP